MANDIWIITNTIVDGRLNNETHDVIKYNGKNKSLNDSVIINEPIYCETNEDLKKFLGQILDEIQALKASNASILSIVEELRTENANLKKMISSQNRLRNFNLYQSNDTNNDDSVAFEPEYVQNGNKKNRVSASTVTKKQFSYAEKVSYGIKNVPDSTKTKPIEVVSKNKSRNFIVGIQRNSDISSAVRPPRLFEYYTGFWSLNSSKESVKEIIGKFAKVENIDELKPKYDYFKSYRFQVLSSYKEAILDSQNCPAGIRVKRYFDVKSDTDSSNKSRVKSSATSEKDLNSNKTKTGYGRNLSIFGHNRGTVRSRDAISDDEDINQAKKIDNGIIDEHRDVFDETVSTNCAETTVSNTAIENRTSQ